MLRSHLDSEEIRIFGRWRSDISRIYARSNHKQMRGVAAKMLAAEGARVRLDGRRANPHRVATGLGEAGAGLGLN